MITLNSSGDALRLTVSGTLDFDASRDLLRKYKLHAQQHDIRKIDIHLSQVSHCSSCAIGALILLSEKAPGQFMVHLDRCTDEVQRLFDSGFLDRFLAIDHAHPVRQELPCTDCYAANCQQPVADCEKAGFLGPDIYPLLQSSAAA